MNQTDHPSDTDRSATEDLAARAQHCLSCNACRPRCDVAVATNRLRPLFLVRMASLGLFPQMLDAAAVWYCQQCKQCSSACPMDVEPASLIRTVRREALRRQEGAGRFLDGYEALLARLQRVRWHLIAQWRQGRDPLDGAPGDDDPWTRWADTPVEPVSTEGVSVGRGTSRAPFRPESPDAMGLSACMTCNECTTVCPVAHERNVFEPLTLFRMAALGMHEELLSSPSIWLCLGCRSCTETCTQGVNGRLVIERLQDAAVQQGRVPSDIRQKLTEFDRVLLPRLLREIDALVGVRG